MRWLVFFLGALLVPSEAGAGVRDVARVESQAFVWVLTAASLVLLMQVGFMFLEAGLVRSKNTINVAQKNLLDLIFSIVAFAVVGFLISFGFDLDSVEWRFFLLTDLSPSESAFFAFQAMFCGTAATIVSGAAAERLRLNSYILCSTFVAGLIYPVIVHLAWGSALRPSNLALLANNGFVDFAGSTVVHSTGAWVSLAACLVLGPRIGRFNPDGKPNRMAGHSAVLATAGTMLIFVGWVGFNGGSTIVATDEIAHIVTNTMLAAGSGGVIGYLLGIRATGVAHPEDLICGMLGGLVAVTAGCHLLDGAAALAIGLLGGAAAIWGNQFVERRLKLDDAVGAIGVHGFAGVTGTLALCFLAPAELLPEGGRLAQLQVQAIGVVTNFCWAFGAAYLFFRVLDARKPIRISTRDEARGMNQSEHDTTLGIGNIETALDRLIYSSADLSDRLPLPRGDEAERVARLFNEFLDKIEGSEIARRSEEEVERASQEAARLSTLADAALEGVLLCVHGRIFDANTAMARLIGTPLDQIRRRDLLDFVAASHHTAIRNALEEGDRAGLDVEVINADGAPIPTELRLRKTSLSGEPVLIATFLDLRERLKNEEMVRYMAHHDPLTGLSNRALFNRALDETLSTALRSKRTGTLILIDLDRFKDINDLYGHPAGDIVLKTCASRLQRMVEGVGTASRCGGDEFAVIVDQIEFVNQAEDYALRILWELRKPIDIGDGVKISAGSSLGVSIMPRDGIAPGTIVSRADTALYHAKRQGKNTYAIYQPGMDLEAQARRELEAELANAIEREEFFICFQPRIDLAGRRICGYEALLRWRHPVRGIISPGVFIPVAEQSGAIVELGEWVLREACRQGLAHLGDTPISINVSAFQFKSRDFIDRTMAILAEVGFPPDRLELELTESVLIDDRDRALAVLKTLKRSGISLSLDDFGTGYSSLSYLRLFPFDALKIDRSFVRDMLGSDNSLAIAEAVIHLGHALNLTIVAEGVETKEQLDLLRSKQCEEVQGYLFSEPVPATEVMREIPKELLSLFGEGDTAKMPQPTSVPSRGSRGRKSGPA